MKAIQKILSVNEINVDYSYQREVDIKRCKRIAKNFSEIMIKPLKIAERKDGTFWVVDGNHTLNALKILGIEKVSCDVFQSSGRDDESPLFVRLNTAGEEKGKSCTPYEVYIAGLSCNDSNYMAIKELMDSVGVEIASGRHSNSKKVICIGILLNRIKCQPLALKEAIHFIKNVWPDDNNAWNAPIIMGCIGIVGALDESNTKRAMNNLRKYSCESLINKASAIAKATDTRRQQCIRQVLFSMAKI
jgi:hypothetical protein